MAYFIHHISPLENFKKIYVQIINYTISLVAPFQLSDSPGSYAVNLHNGTPIYLCGTWKDL